MVLNTLDRLILQDDRIRKIIVNNAKMIRDIERNNGNCNLHQLNQYLANKLSVWEQHKTGKYLSVNLLVKYLKYCGYSLDYYIEPIEDNIK